METLGAVALAIVVSVIAPTVLAYLTGRQRRQDAAQMAELKSKEREQDWARQDEIADRVEKVAEKAVLVAEKAAADQIENAGTLKDIHTLVNSDMTAARTAELSTTRLLIAALKRIGNGDGETADAIAGAEARATELEVILADRLVAQKKVEADAAAHAVATAASAAHEAAESAR